MASNLTRRILFAVVAIPAVGGIAWLGGWPFAALVAVAAALGAREVYGFARAQGIEPLARLGMAGAALIPLTVVVTRLGPAAFADVVRNGYVFAFGLLALLVAALWRRAPGARPLTAVAVTVFGALYAGWLLSYALVLRHPYAAAPGDAPTGMALLFYPLVLTWGGDTAAMAAGRTFGGPKLAPVISPNKTWAGGIAGLLGSIALSLIYAAVVFTRAGIALTLGQALLFGVAISVAGQLGDVVESLFKREIGIKDSSTLIPGHGGILDRLDALYFVLPVTAMLYDLARIP